MNATSDFASLAAQHALGDEPIPKVVVALAAGHPVELAWRNELGGLTFQIENRFVKWNPRRTGIDLERERVRLEWIAGRHPAPRVVAAGSDEGAQWLVTGAVPGECAVGDTPGDRVAQPRLELRRGNQHELFHAYGIEPDEAANPLLPRAVAPRVIAPNRRRPIEPQLSQAGAAR